MKRLFTALSICALVYFALILSPLRAETVAKPAGSLSYDISKEVTFNATVSGVLAKPNRGMLMGSHLLLSTGGGSIDASLGSFGLQGKRAVSVVAGQQVEVTGVLKSIKNKPVFLTRIVKVNGESYAIRNQRGVPLSPEARERLSRKTAGGGM
jgi:hypothetical protein